MRTPPVHFILSVSVATVLGLSCATAPSPLPGSESNGFGGALASPPYRTPSHFNQSCGATCAAPISSSTGEILAPMAARTGQVLEKAIQVTQAVQGFLNVLKFLDESQKGRAEALIVECVKTAHFKVETELFGEGKSLPDSDCNKPPTVKKKLAPDWARHLGRLKHAAAFECIQQALAKEFPNNFSIEPRYRREALTNDLLLTDRWGGSKRPDVVLHFTRNATRIQCIYELKFPCGNEQGNPWGMENVQLQMEAYRALGGECEPVIVTPQLEISRQQ